MIKNTKKYLLIFFVLTVFVSMDSSKRLVDEIIQDFTTYHRLFPKEKIFLHFDKKLYTTGETIWFKAYLVHGTSHQPDTLSGTLYVDLIKPDQQKIIFSRMLEVKDGVTYGDISLPDTLPSGNYKIRAYTNWMRNFDENFFYTKEIPVYNYKLPFDYWNVTSKIIKYDNEDSVFVFFELKDQENQPLKDEVYSYTIQIEDDKYIQDGVVVFNENGNVNLKFSVPNDSVVENATIKLINDSGGKEFSVALNDRKPEVNFFPEGGEMIAGVSNVIAFEAITREGNPMELKGDIIDQDSNQIARFETYHEGMGAFLIKPEIGKRYLAEINYQDTKYIYELPEVKRTGILFSAINNYDDQLNIRLFKNDPDNKLKGTFALVGQVRGKVYWASQFKMSHQSSMITVPKSTFPTGVLQLTLFDQDHRPLMERLVFINHNDFLNISLNTGKNDYEPRDKVDINIDVNDSEAKPVKANLSAVAIDLNQLDEEHEENIISYLMLSSDVKGKIRNASYYFEDQSKERQKALDLLMMTRGWRRFQWEKVLQQNYPVVDYLPEKGFSVCGTATRSWNNKPVDEGQITFSIFGNNPEFILVNTGENGKFCFDDLRFKDTVDVLIQTANKRGNNRDMNLNLDSADWPKIHPEFNMIHITSIVEHYITESKERDQIAMAYGLSKFDRVLDEVIIEGQRAKTKTEPYKLYGEADVSLNLEEMSTDGFFSLIDLLQGRVAGVQVIGSGANARVVIRGGGGGFFSGENADPLFLLDGMPVDMDFIQNINIHDVENIDVLKTAATTSMYGTRGANGVIAVYTKRGEYIQETAKGIINMKYPGYYVPREFYSPDYDVPKDEHAIPDHRAVIHWEPVITTDASGKAKISFYHSDLKTKARIYVQGISVNGIPGIGKVDYEVK